MKDLPHHIKKLNRKVIRSIHRADLEEEAYDLTTPSLPPRKQTERQRKKQAKVARRKEAHIPVPPNTEDQNKKMKHRVPVFDRINNALPRYTKPTKKKPPRI